ncbi:hypothetical protein BAP_2575 [Bacillus sp. CN2]|nr:hypothetical protein BAP_2575 [Bacillus sp. CN2]
MEDDFLLGKVCTPDKASESIGLILRCKLSNSKSLYNQL